jgi:hypothetical protein
MDFATDQTPGMKDQATQRADFPEAKSLVNLDDSIFGGTVRESERRLSAAGYDGATGSQRRSSSAVP